MKALAGVLAAFLIVLLLAGCRGKSLTSPEEFGGTSHWQGALSLENPRDVALVMRVQNRYTPELLKLPGVIGTGTGATVDGRPAIVLLTGKARAASVASVDGIPVVSRVVGTVIPYAKKPGGGPLKMGIQSISFAGNNTIDAAIAVPAAGRAFTCAEAGGYTPSSVTAPSVGLAVKKTGHTGGLTHGTIQAINVTVQVHYGGGVATFVNQIMTDAQFVRSGDSGALMVTESGDHPVGVCFAGGPGATFANPIGPVLSRFSATVCSQ
jgi:hypothetical protein